MSKSHDYQLRENKLACTRYGTFVSFSNLLILVKEQYNVYIRTCCVLVFCSNERSFVFLLLFKLWYQSKYLTFEYTFVLGKKVSLLYSPVYVFIFVLWIVYILILTLYLGVVQIDAKNDMIENVMNLNCLEVIKAYSVRALVPRKHYS